MLTLSVVFAVTAFQEDKAKLTPPLPTAFMFAVCQASQDGKSVSVATHGWGSKTQTYTVMIPMQTQVQDENGAVRNVVRMVPETRTREVKHVGRIRKVHRIDECKFTDLHGNPVPADEVAKRLRKQAPVLVLSPDQKLEPFYRTVLQPSLLIVVLPGGGVAPPPLRAPAPVARPPVARPRPAAKAAPPAKKK